MNRLKYLYRAYRYRYLKDAVEINYILRKLKKGDIAVDIGCHKGAYLHWMQQQVGTEGYCYAFEPQPILFKYLQGLLPDRQVGSSNTENLKIEQLAFSNKTGELLLNVPPNKKGSSPSATLNTITNQSGWMKHKVKVTTLDDYFLPLSGDPSFMKIDVEGHEYEVLQGGEQLLKTKKPTLLVECENRHLNNRTVDDVFALLGSYGYKGFFIYRKSILPIEEFDVSRHQVIKEGRFWEEEDYVNNFIFDSTT